jgi:hypothetical protein
VLPLIPLEFRRFGIVAFPIDKIGLQPKKLVLLGTPIDYEVRKQNGGQNGWEKRKHGTSNLEMGII